MMMESIKQSEFLTLQSNIQKILDLVCDRENMILINELYQFFEIGCTEQNLIQKQLKNDSLMRDIERTEGYARELSPNASSCQGPVVGGYKLSQHYQKKTNQIFQEIKRSTSNPSQSQDGDFPALEESGSILEENFMSQSMSFSSAQKTLAPRYFEKLSNEENNPNGGNAPVITFQKRENIYFDVFFEQLPKTESFILYDISFIELDGNRRVFKIQKRFRDFMTLHEELVEKLKIKLPEPPKKTLILSQEQEAQRIEKLTEYMTILLNDSIYFCEELFKFAGFDPETQQLLYGVKLRFNFKKFSVTCVGHQITNNNEVGDSYVIYRFLVKKRGENFKIIEKRYSDFCDLDQKLQERYRNLVKMKKLSKGFSMPELPPKLSPFGYKTSVSYRQVHLEKYLNQLFQLDQIEQSYLFLQFI